MNYIQQRSVVILWIVPSRGLLLICKLCPAWICCSFVNCVQKRYDVILWIVTRRCLLLFIDFDVVHNPYCWYSFKKSYLKLSTNLRLHLWEIIKKCQVLYFYLIFLFFLMTFMLQFLYLDICDSTNRFCFKSLINLI